MNQHLLFNDLVTIHGLTYLSSYICPDYEQELVCLIDGQSWNTELKRRTQHYGYKYAYMARSIDTRDALGPMPKWIENLCCKLYDDAFFREKPDQVIINEYRPAQGISPHIDCPSSFAEVVCSLSLASGCSMDLIKGDLKHSIYLEPRSLLVLQGDARYTWQHGIAARKSDRGIRRQRRISLTFRKVIL